MRTSLFFKLACFFFYACFKGMKVCRSFFLFFFPNYQKPCVTQIPVSLLFLSHCTQQHNLAAAGAKLPMALSKNIKMSR